MQSNIMDTLRGPLVGTRVRWRAAGITEGQMRTLTRSGDLVRMRRGVYATRSAIAWAGSDPGRGHALLVIAATCSLGRDSVASHHSAAFIHGLDLLGPAPRDVVTLTRPVSRRGSQRDGIIFHAAAIPPEHMTRCSGALVTTVSRTVVDLARTLPYMDGVVVADSALRTGLTSKPELEHVMDWCCRWPGVDQARRTIRFADGLAESALESCARVVFARSGLEAPELQITFRGQGFVYRGDFYWARYRTIAEADGMAKYDIPQHARDQIRRDRLLRDAGYKVVHFTWRELFESPDQVIARIRRAFASPTAF